MNIIQFYKNYLYFPVSKKSVRRVALFEIFIYLFNYGLIAERKRKESWVLVFAFVFNLLLSHTLCCLQKIPSGTH